MSSKTDQVRWNRMWLQALFCLILSFSFTFSQAQYCAAGGNPTCSQVVTNGINLDTIQVYIQQVVLSSDTGDITNNTLCDEYGNYTGIRAPWTVGSPYTVTVNPNNEGANNIDGIAVAYIDWNNNGNFDDPGETFPSTVGEVPYVIAVNVPATASQGIKRMRIRTTSFLIGPDPCGTQEGGEVEDYSIYLSALLNPAPLCLSADSCSPNKNASVCLSTDSLRWKAVSGATGYLLTVRNIESGAFIASKDTIKGTSYSLKNKLVSGASYRWIAVPYSNNGNAFGCDSVDFETYSTNDPKVTLNPGPQVSVCPRMTQNLNSSITGGAAPLTYNWTGLHPEFLDATNQQNVVFASPNTDTYVYTLTVSDANGCKGKDSVFVAVKKGPSYHSLEVLPPEICAGQDFALRFSKLVGTLEWGMSTTGENGPFPNVTLNQLNDSVWYKKMHTPGDYHFVAIIVNNACSMLSDTVKITVKANPVKPIITPSSATICAGQKATLTVSNHSTNISWNVQGMPTSPSIEVSASGAYSATITEGKCSSTSDPVQVVVNESPAKPTIKVEGKNPACSGQTIRLISSSATDNTWNSGATTQEINPSVSGDYTVTVTNSFNCSTTSESVNILFRDPLSKPIITLSNNGMYCVGDHAELSSSYAGGNSWSTGESTAKITVNSAGFYYVTYTDGNGCSITSDATQVTFNPLPAKPVITETSSSAHCDGETVVLESSIQAEYSWSTGETSQSISVFEDGDYEVTVTDINGCKRSSAPYHLNFYPLPAKPTIEAMGSFCAGTVGTLRTNHTNGNSWSTGDNSQSIEVVSNGDYSVIYTDIHGCKKSSDPYAVEFHALPAKPVVSQEGNELISSNEGVSYQWFDETGLVSGANSRNYSPTHGGYFSVMAYSAEGCPGPVSDPFYLSGTGISEIDPGNIQILPNPSHGKFKIELSQISSGSWILSDLSGKQVAGDNFSSSSVELHLNLSKGMYLLTLNDGLRLIKQRVVIE